MLRFAAGARNRSAGSQGKEVNTQHMRACATSSHAAAAVPVEWLTALLLCRDHASLCESLEDETMVSASFDAEDTVEEDVDEYSLDQAAGEYS